MRNDHPFRTQRRRMHRSTPSRQRYYAVSAGWKTGIVSDPAAYIQYTSGFSRPQARRFSTYHDAAVWLAYQLSQKTARSAASGPTARQRNQSRRVKRYIGSCAAAQVFVIDIELTGLTPHDEILQVSVLDGLGRVCCNEYFRPAQVVSWDDTVPVHGITPERVAACPPFAAFAPVLSRLLRQAQCIAGYSTMQDMAALCRGGAVIPQDALYLDLGEAYSFVPSGDHRYRTYAKLKDCAAYYGYDGGGWHDSLADAKATLHCLYAMLDDDQACFRLTAPKRHDPKGTP